MYIDELAKMAKEVAGFKPDAVIDDEERHYNREAVEKYEAILVGGVYIHNKLMEKAREWLDINFPIIDSIGSWYKEGFIKQFKKAMEDKI